MERQHAIDTARNTLGSKIGKELLDGNKFPDRQLQLKLQKINTDLKKHKSLHDSNRRSFKSQGLIYNFEPTIVVERASSPIHYDQLVKKFEIGKGIPHYMTGLERARPKDYIPMVTVDAFKIQKQKKKNLWESKDKIVNFKSILLKSPHLLPLEQTDLEKGWKVYRPVSRLEAIAQDQLKQKNDAKKHLASTVRRRKTTPSTFITQLDTWDIEPDNREETVKPSVFSQLQQQQQTLLEARKMRSFDAVRERQKKFYYKYIRN